MAMTFGYARVATAGQTLDSQIDALVAAGVDRRQIRVETASGARDDRPVLSELVEQVQDGDTIVVTKLDRLGRSVAHLVELTTRLDGRGVALVSLSEQIDTSTAAGRFMVHVLAALAQMERDLIRERTVAGLAAARARGRVGGRPTVMTPDRQEAAAALLADGQSAAAVARALGISESTVRRHATRGSPA